MRDIRIELAKWLSAQLHPAQAAEKEQGGSCRDSNPRRETFAERMVKHVAEKNKR
jgi:hypothetical protein